MIVGDGSIVDVGVNVMVGVDVGLSVLLALGVGVRVVKRVAVLDDNGVREEFIPPCPNDLKRVG